MIQEPWKKRAFDSILKHEGSVLDPNTKHLDEPFHKPYRDTLGNWTIGYGHLVTPDDPEYGHGEDTLVPEKRARELALEDFNIAINDARSLTNNFDALPDTYKETLTEMAYQLGRKNLSGFDNFLGELNSPNPDPEVLQREMLNSRWATQTPNRAAELASRVHKAGIKDQDFIEAAESENAATRRRLASLSGSLDGSPRSDPISYLTNQQSYNWVPPQLDQRNNDAQDIYSLAQKRAELFGPLPGYEQLTAEDFLPSGVLSNPDLSPEQNWEKILDTMPDRTPLFNPGVSKDDPYAYVSKTMRGPMANTLYMPFVPGDITAPAADLQNYGDIIGATNKYFDEQLTKYDEEGPSDLNEMKAYVDASVFASLNFMNQTTKASDWWRSVIPNAIATGWDYLTTDDKERRKEILDRMPTFEQFFNERKPKKGATEQEKQAAFVKAAAEWRETVETDENKKRVGETLHDLARQWNIPVKKVPELLMLLSHNRLPASEKSIAANTARIAAIESEDYWAKPFWIVPSQGFEVTETKPPAGVFAYPTNRAEVGLDLAIAGATWGLGGLGVKIPSLLFNNFLGAKAQQASKLFAQNSAKRQLLHTVEKDLTTIGGTLKFVDRLRELVRTKFKGKGRFDDIDPLKGSGFKAGDLDESWPLTWVGAGEVIGKVNHLVAKRNYLRKLLKADDDAIFKLTGRKVPTLDKYGKRRIKRPRKGDPRGVGVAVDTARHFYPQGSYLLRLADEVAFTHASNAVSSNFVFTTPSMEHPLGVKYAEEGDVEEQSAVAHFLMALTPLIGGVAIGTFKSWDKFDPLLKTIKEVNEGIDPTLLGTGERRNVTAVSLDPEGVPTTARNPFARLSHDPDTAFPAYTKETLIGDLVTPRAPFDPEHYKWAWSNLRHILLDPERRKEVSRVMELGRKRGVPEELLKWFDDGLNDLYKRWDVLASDPEKQARRFIKEDLDSKDINALQNIHEHRLQQFNAEQGIHYDPRSGRALVQEGSVIQRKGNLAVVQKELPDGTVEITTYQTPKKLSGPERVFYDLSLGLRKQVNAAKMLSPRHRAGVIIELGKQAAATAVELLPKADTAQLQRVADAFGSFNRVDRFFGGADTKTLRHYSEMSNESFIKMISDVKGTSRFNEVRGILERIPTETQDIFAEYVKGRMRLYMMQAAQHGDNITPRLADLVSNEINTISQKIANTAYAKSTKEIEGLNGFYTRVSDTKIVDPNKPFTKTVNGKKVTIDAAAYIDENFIQPYIGKRSRRKDRIEIAGDREVVRAVKGGLRGKGMLHRPGMPRTIVSKHDNAAIQRLLREDPNLEVVDITNDPTIPDVVYAITMDAKTLGLESKDYILPNKVDGSFRVYVTSLKDAGVVVYDIREGSLIGGAKNLNEAKDAFREMVEYNTGSGMLLNYDGITKDLDELFERLDRTAKNVDDVAEFYRLEFLSSEGRVGFREAHGGAKSPMRYTAEMFSPKVRKTKKYKKSKVEDTNVISGNKYDINENTLVLREKGTNRIRVYGDLGRSHEKAYTRFMQDLSSAGYPLGTKTSDDMLKRAAQRGQEQNILADGTRAVEHQWLGNIAMEIPKALADAAAKALSAEKTGLIKKDPDAFIGTAEAQRWIGANHLFGMPVSTAANADVGITWFETLVRQYPEMKKQRLERLNALRAQKKEATNIIQRGLIEAAARMEVYSMMIGRKHDRLDAPVGRLHQLREHLDWIIPGSAIQKFSQQGMKTAEIIFRARGKSDFLKAKTSKFDESFLSLDTRAKLEVAREQIDSLFSRVNPYFHNQLDWVRIRVFDRMQQHNGVEFFSGTPTNKYKDAYMSKIERFDELTPEEQNAKIFLSNKPDDFVLLKDMKLYHQMMDENILAPRRYMMSTLSTSQYESWLSNYFPRIWSITKSVQNWNANPEKFGFKEGTEEYLKAHKLYDEGKLTAYELDRELGLLPPGFRMSANLEDNHHLVRAKWQEFRDDIIEGRIRPDGKAATGFRKPRTGLNYLLRDPEVYTKDFFDQMLMKGFVPETWNPVEQVRAKADQMDNYYMGARQLNDMLSSGLVFQVNYDQLIDMAAKHRALGEAHFDGGHADFKLNFVDVTENIASLVPSLFTDDVRAINKAIGKAIDEKGKWRALDPYFRYETPVTKLPDGTVVGTPSVESRSTLPLETIRLEPDDKTLASIISARRKFPEDEWEAKGLLETSFEVTLDPRGVIQQTKAWENIPEAIRNQFLERKFGGKKFYADPQVARIIQNITSQGLAARSASLGNEIGWLGASMWDKWRRSNNYLNSVNLGWSFFHFSSVTVWESFMGDLTRFTRSLKQWKDLSRPEALTKFARGEGEADQEINANWFRINSALKSLPFPLSLPFAAMQYAGQFPVKSRIPTLGFPNIKTGRSEPTPLIPSLMEKPYKSRTGLGVRQWYEDHLTKKVGDEIQGKGFVQVMDEVASYFRGKEWTPIQDTFNPPILKRDDPRYAEYNVGALGTQVENILRGVTPTDLVNPVFMDIINAGVDANFLNPLAAQAGRQDIMYTFGRTWVDAVQFYRGEAHATEYNAMSMHGKAMRQGLTRMSMPARYVGIAAQEGQKWLFESIIPHAKYAAFMEMMFQEVFQKPHALDVANNPGLLRKIAADVGASIDNRFGMLNYDNLLMDRAMKDLMFLYWRAPAWKLGTKREILGGVRDMTYLIGLKGQRGLDRLAGIKGKVPEAKRVGEVEELSHRAAYLYGMLGFGYTQMLIQYAKTGTWPDFQWNDEDSTWNNILKNLQLLWFPLSGDSRATPYGPMPMRFSMPTYHKDPLKWFEDYGLGFINHFAEAAPPLWQVGRLAWTGKTHDQFSIYPAEVDAYPTMGMSWLAAKSYYFTKEAVRGQLPFSLTQLYDRFMYDDAPASALALEYFGGIKSSPVGFTRSPAVEASMDLMIADLPTSARPEFRRHEMFAARKLLGEQAQGKDYSLSGIKAFFRRELEEAGQEVSETAVGRATERVSQILQLKRRPLYSRRKLFEEMLRKARSPHQITHIVGLMDAVEFTAFFGDNEHDQALRLKSLRPEALNFGGNPSYLQAEYETLKSLVKEKALTQTIEGLFELEESGTEEEIREKLSFIPRWVVALIGARKERERGR